MEAMNKILMKALGVDSLDEEKIIRAMEKEYGIKFPDEGGEKSQVVGDLVRYVKKQTE